MQLTNGLALDVILELTEQVQLLVAGGAKVKELFRQGCQLTYSLDTAPLVGGCVSRYARRCYRYLVVCRRSSNGAKHQTVSVKH